MDPPIRLGNVGTWQLTLEQDAARPIVRRPQLRQDRRDVHPPDPHRKLEIAQLAGLQGHGHTTVSPIATLQRSADSTSAWWDLFIIKSVLGFRQFLLRTLDCVRGEWSLVTMAWNMKRRFTLGPSR